MTVGFQQLNCSLEVEIAFSHLLPVFSNELGGIFSLLCLPDQASCLIS